MPGRRSKNCGYFPSYRHRRGEYLLCHPLYKALQLSARCRRGIIPHVTLRGLGVQSVVARHHHHHHVVRLFRCNVDFCLPPQTRHGFSGARPAAALWRFRDASLIEVLIQRVRVNVVTVRWLLNSLERTKPYCLSYGSARSREGHTTPGRLAQPCVTLKRRLLATARGLCSNGVPRDPLVLPRSGIHTDRKLITGC